MNPENRNDYEIRKQKVYSLMCEDFYKPMKIKELCVLMQVSPQERPVLEQILNELQMEGKIALSKRGKYSKAEETVTTGTFMSHPKGFGFVRVEGQADDIFIPAEYTLGAMHQDIVSLTISPVVTGKRKEGRILAILERGYKTLVCTYQKSRNFGFAIPDIQKFSRDIFIPAGQDQNAGTGDKIVVEITDYGKEGRNPEGKIVEILGPADAPGVDILSILKAYNLSAEFPAEVQKQADKANKPVSEADLGGRLDLRDLLCITIDGDDSKDFDDAVSLTREGDYYILGVHIADVANYVQEGSALDREALSRGTSVYLTDRVVPMLPFALSNGICSLNEGVDRLTLSCMMTINEKGEIIDHQVAESVIRSRNRMTYTKVRKIIQREEESLVEEYGHLVPMLDDMAHVSELLRKRRRNRGAIDFDFPEPKIRLDARRKAAEILLYERNCATKLIEDFMLAANETIAEDFYWQDLPFLYRTHETPDSDKIRALNTFIANFGYNIHIGTDEIHPKEIQKLMDKIEGTEEEALISRLTLRSMKKAKYTPECSGHFGLSAPYYCHFTSPIRRYPDLQIHRIIKDQLRGRLNEERSAHYAEILPAVARQSSDREVQAEEAERETLKLKKAEYMKGHIGEVYQGVISGVIESGFFVEIPNTVEGLIRVTQLLDDFYTYYADSYMLMGQASGRAYKLGQKVLVRCTGADTVLRTVDFELA